MSHQPKLYNSIITAGLIAGTLDISAACIGTYIRSGKTPDVVLRFIATAAFGKSASQGGTEILIAGLLFHYLIAFSFVIAFFFIYSKFKKQLSSYNIITGLGYGLIVWCIMNLLVLPLTKLPAGNPPMSQVITGMLFLMFLIGLPAAIFAKRYYSAAKN